jgi:hypothetical protein
LLQRRYCNAAFDDQAAFVSIRTSWTGIAGLRRVSLQACDAFSGLTTA